MPGVKDPHTPMLTRNDLLTITIPELQARIQRLQAELDLARHAAFEARSCIEAVAETGRTDCALAWTHRHGWQDQGGATNWLLRLAKLAGVYRRCCCTPQFEGSADALEALRRHAYNDGADPL